MTRDEHLAWCKRRALEYVDAGDIDQARTSMLSDLQKWEKPLYDSGTLGVLMMDAVLYCQTPEKMRYWINGFK
jgi:hypothetical protein